MTDLRKKALTTPPVIATHEEFDKDPFQGWAKAPSCELKRVRHLRIDHWYQRKQVGSKRFFSPRKIADHFHPVLFGALTVGNRTSEPKVFYVIDGQQRLKAAEMKGFDKVPCLVFPSLGREYEAWVFKHLATDRTRISSVQAFKADIVAGDPIANEIHSTMKTYRIGFNEEGYRGEFNLSCTRSLESLYVRYRGAHVIDQAFMVANMAWSRDLYKSSLQSWLLMPLGEFIGNAEKKIPMLGSKRVATDIDRLINRLQKYTPSELRMMAREHKARNGGADSSTMAMLHVLSEIYRARK